MKNSKLDNYKQFTLQMNIDGHMLISESQIEYQDEVTSYRIIGKGDYATCMKLQKLLAKMLALENLKH